MLMFFCPQTFCFIFFLKQVSHPCRKASSSLHLLHSYADMENAALKWACFENVGDVMHGLLEYDISCRSLDFSGKTRVLNLAVCQRRNILDHLF